MQEETCCPINSNLPIHAWLATTGCEAIGTMYPAFQASQAREVKADSASVNVEWGLG